MPKFKIVKQIGQPFTSDRGGVQYKFLASDDEIYSTWSKRFPELVGKETEYELTGKEYNDIKGVKLGSGGWSGGGGRKNDDPRSFALGSSARIVASMVQAIEPTVANLKDVEKAWEKLYGFAIAKLSDSPKSGAVPKEEPKRITTDSVKEEYKEKSNKELDIDVQIQDIEKTLNFDDERKSKLRATCNTNADYLKFLQSFRIIK